MKSKVNNSQLFGLDYIMFRTDILSSSTMALIFEEHGVVGALLALILPIYIAANGYYVKWTAAAARSFHRMFVPTVMMKKMQSAIDYMVSIDYFDRVLFETKRILTSDSRQMEFLKTKMENEDFNPNKLPYLIDEADRFIISRFGKYERMPDNDENTASEARKRKAETVSDLKLSGQNEVLPHTRARLAKRSEEKRSEEEINYSSSNNNLNKEEEEEERARKRDLNINLFEENKEIWIPKILSDENWKKNLKNFSGKGDGIIDCLAPALNNFVKFLNLCGNTDAIGSLDQMKARFFGYWKANNFTTDMEELATGRKERPKARKESRTEEMKRACDEAMAYFDKQYKL